MANTKKTHPGTPPKGKGRKAKPAAGSRKPPSQRPKRKVADPDLKDCDYVESVELRRGRSRTVTNAAERPKRSSPRKDSMGFIDPDAIDPEAYEDVIAQPELDPPPFKPTTTKNRSPIAIVKRFLQKKGQEAVQQQLAGVYASLMGSPHPPDPTYIPGAATAGAAAAADDEMTGYGDGLVIGDEGIGEDDYVVEKDAERYDQYGIVKINVNYDDDSDFADEKPPADMSYYRDTNDMRGRNLTRGGPERPDTSGMTEAGANAEIKKWRKARKKYTDGLLAAKAKLRKSLEETDDYDV